MTVAVPVSVAPALGAVSETVGGVVSSAGVVAVAGEDGADSFARRVRTALTV